MNEMKELGGAIVLLFMLLGAVDLIFVGSIATVLGIAHGTIAGALVGAGMLAIGLGMAVMFWRSK